MVLTRLVLCFSVIALLAGKPCTAAAQEAQSYIELYQKGAQALREGARDEAITYFEQALKAARANDRARPEDIANLHFILALQFLRADRTNDALPHIDAYLSKAEAIWSRKSKQYYHGLDLRARINTERKAYDLARRDYRAMIALASEIAGHDPQEELSARLQYTRTFILEGNGDGAEEGAQALLKRITSLRKVRKDRQLYLFEEAVALAYRGAGLRFKGQARKALKNLQDSADLFLANITNFDKETRTEFYLVYPVAAMLDDTYGRLNIIEIGHAIRNGTIESRPIPLLRIPPTYPQWDARNGRVGFAVIEFTIDETGRARDVEVIDENGKNFGRNAKIMIRDWRFVPRIVNNVPQKTTGRRIRVDYTIAW